MAERSRRDIGLFVAGVAAGVVLALLPQWAGSTGPESAPIAIDQPDAPSSSEPESGPALEAREAPVDDAAEDAHAPYEGTPRPAADPLAQGPAAKRGAALALKLTGAYDPEKHTGVAYALLAGSPGTDDEDDVPTTWADESKRLPLPAGGTYDIGFRIGARLVFRRDVTVPDGETKPFEIEVPPAEYVDLVWDGEAIPENGQVTVYLKVDEADRTWLPGRDERVSWSHYRAVYFGKDVPTRIEVPPDEPMSVVVRVLQKNDKDKWLRDPRRRVVPSSTTVRAGDRLRLTLGPATTYPLVFNGQPKPTRDLSVPVRLTLEQGGAIVQRSRATLHVPCATTKPDALRRLQIAAAPGRARLRLAGEHIQPIELDLEIPRKPSGKPHVVTVQPRTDWSALETRAWSAEEDETATIALRFEGPQSMTGFEWGPEAIGLFDPEDPRDEEVDIESLEPGATELQAYWARAKKVVFVYRGEYASRPMTLPRSGATTVKLLPAGYLVAVPSELLAEGLGTLRLARVDGVPVYGTTAEETTRYVGWAERRIGVQAGTVIGPLPAGTYRFRVWLGQLRLRDVVATVRAGANTPLVIRR